MSTVRTKLRSVVERRPSMPLFVFVGVPVALVVVFFTWQSWWSWLFCLALGAVIFLAFLVYLFTVKREEEGSLGASIPTIFGPLATNLFVQNRSPDLWIVLDQYGGDRLIQIAFLFAGVIGLVVYQITGLREVTSESAEPEFARRRSAARTPLLLSFVVIVTILTILTMVPDFAPAKKSAATVFGIESPVLTPLTVCRIILALLSVALATLPKPVSKANG